MEIIQKIKIKIKILLNAATNFHKTHRSRLPSFQVLKDLCLNICGCYEWMKFNHTVTHSAFLMTLLDDQAVAIIPDLTHLLKVVGINEWIAFFTEKEEQKNALREISS